MQNIKVYGEWKVASRDDFFDKENGDKEKQVLFAVKTVSGTYTCNYFGALCFDSKVKVGKLINKGLVLVFAPRNAWSLTNEQVPIEITNNMCIGDRPTTIPEEPRNNY